MALFWLPLLLLTVQAEVAPSPVKLFDGTFEQWVVEYVPHGRANDTATGTAPAVHNDALLIANNSGWMHTRQPYTNFRLSLDFRPDPNARAGLYFRTWTRLDNDTGRPENGYEVPLDVARSSAGTWHQLILECRGQRADVTIDGQLVTSFTGLENSSGYIGFRGETGVVWVRNVLLTNLDPPRSDRLIGERAGPGVVLPIVIRQVRPAYTAAAMRARIAGSVRLEAVVREDGSVGDVHVLRSVDAKHGMDEACVAAVREWRFQPGTKNGVPVPVIVSIDLTFTLK